MTTEFAAVGRSLTAMSVCVCVCKWLFFFLSFSFARLDWVCPWIFPSFYSVHMTLSGRAGKRSEWAWAGFWRSRSTLKDSYRRRRELKMQWTSDTQLLLILNMFAFLLDFPRFFSPRRLLALLAHRCCSFALHTLHWEIMTAAMPSVSATEWQ